MNWAHEAAESVWGTFWLVVSWALRVS